MVGIIIKNLPVEYNRNEIIQLLFDDDEKKMIKLFTLYKVEKNEIEKSISKAIVFFQNDTSLKEEIESIVKKLDGLKLNEVITLKVLPFKNKKKNKNNNIHPKQNKNANEGATDTKRSEKEDVAPVKTEKGSNSKEKMVFVKGIPYNCTNPSDLANFFSVDASEVRIPLRKLCDIRTNEIYVDSSKNNGYAFIQFSDDVDVDAIIKDYDNKEFKNRSLKVAHLRNFKQGRRTTRTSAN